ncbi:hypothetical protein KIW84_052974 [Lathyrus oleraceus]|uniref:Ubiquitin-like protease family profile domain-containing protein n=1 Tax=Pisum sativum TaxID=3888 RepID=A0A9D5AG02_PEA|nr:hypothetical protein KIW84_052974 [Pisum sativum]
MWTCFEIFVVIFGELAIGCELRTMDSVILCRLRLNQLETIGGLVDSENGLLSSFILQVVYVFEYCYTLPCRYGFSCHWMLGCLHCVYRMTQLSMSIVNDWFNVLVRISLELLKHGSGHWLLLAINPIREIVYYLDSLGNDWTTYPDMKVLIDTVLQAFRAQRDIQTSRRGANSITWIKVACPQQRNQIDCGYFMLRFMRDTLALGRLKIPTDYFEEFKCAFYTKDQVDEIKEEWCQFMIELNVCS